MTEKEMLIDTWNNEFQTTMRVFKAYPTDKLDLRPAEKSRTARELAWIMCADEILITGAMQGKIDFSPGPPPPSTLEEVISIYERVHKSNMRKLKKLTPAQFKRKIKFPVGPKKVGEVPTNNLLWFTMFDHIHHRGQFSIYLRIAGGKLPSIYGPTADEPWW